MVPGTFGPTNISTWAESLFVQVYDSFLDFLAKTILKIFQNHLKKNEDTPYFRMSA
jgi:hypothetical protein